ncbi:MAG: thioredoxin family protein [Pseudomonadota bacterium]|nr:thioredoxin family protein [Gammaproteobacteria bacterium]MBU1927111.1 thioredoxin family protein [Gammaproteobacteria bacterium]
MIEIKIFGFGCSTCKKLKKLVDNIVRQNKLEANVEYITDFAEIAKFNIMSSPAIMIDGEIKAAGRVPTRTEIENWIHRSP